MKTLLRLRRSPNRRKGVAIVEFTFSLVVLVPLLLGVFVFGFRLIRSLQMQQIVRDLGHMYIRGIDFRGVGPIQNAQTMSQSFDLTASGKSLIILSTMRIAVQADCDAGNPTAPPGTACANKNKAVFTEQVMIGNTSLSINGVTAHSAFGTPPLDASKRVTPASMANSGTAASTLNSVLTLKVGEFAYVAEMITSTPDLNIPGFSGSPQVYARAIF